MKKSLVISIFVSSFVFLTIFVLYYSSKQRNLENDATNFLSVISKWENNNDLSKVTQDDIAKLDLVLSEENFDLIEIMVIDEKTSEILASKDSGRFKLTRWFSSDKKAYGFNYDRFDFVGSEGEFPVVQFYSDSLKSDILIKGIFAIEH